MKFPAKKKHSRVSIGNSTMVEIRQRCPNSSRISTCFQILVEFGHCRNSDGEILFVEIPENLNIQ